MTTKSVFADRLTASVGGETGGLLRKIHTSMLRHVPDLTIDHHERILKGLMADGIGGESGDVVHAASGADTVMAGKHQLLTPLQARAATQASDPHAVTAVLRDLERINYSAKPDELIDVVRLTECMRSSKWDIESRMALRCRLAMLRMIP
jgi:hypothetical protein